MKTKITLSLLAFALVVTGCAGQGSGAGEQESPEQVVQHFYNWYLDKSQADPKDPRQSGVLTSDLSARIESARASGQPGSGSNFVCAQDFPDSVSVGSASIEGENATVPVETSWGGRLRISLVSTEEGWLIQDVECVR